MDTLLRMLEETNYVQVARILGVSDNAIRKHIKITVNNLGWPSGLRQRAVNPSEQS